MKQRHLKSSPCLTIGVIVCLLLACGIASRYRMDLYVASEDSQKKVDVEQADLIQSATLGDPFDDYKISGGDANVAVVTMATRWGEMESDRFRLMGFDEYWRCKLFLELPEAVEAGPVQLEGNSFLQLMGRYSVSVEDKVYLSSEGSGAVDSVTSKHIFFTIDARYHNRGGEQLGISGRFKVDRSD